MKEPFLNTFIYIYFIVKYPRDAKDELIKCDVCQKYILKKIWLCLQLMINLYLNPKIKLTVSSGQETIETCC